MSQSRSGYARVHQKRCITPRESFLAALFNGPLLYADAIVVFSGDGTTRLEVAVGALRQRSAHWCVVSGGVDNPPHSLTAREMRDEMIRQGLTPDRIIMDPDSQNTRDQAEALAVLVKAKGWTNVLLAVSPYHAPRAYLTVLASLKAAGLDEVVHVQPLTASQTPWWGRPEGLDVTRMDLFGGELAKIDEYGAKGHVASYEDGLAYLRYWEGRIRS